MSEGTAGLRTAAGAVIGRLASSAAMLRAQADALVNAAEELKAALAGDGAWAFPVGTAEHPPEAWYVAVWHDLTGARNGGYRHTGIDINLDRWPWGDVERGAPVWAVADGRVAAKGSSSGWLGVVVIEVQHHGLPLQVRYAHLDPDSIPVVMGQAVKAGDHLGNLGNWQGGDGGDHLHLDMGWNYFGWDWWLTAKVEWVDPVPVLREHLDPGMVDRMLGKNDG